MPRFTKAELQSYRGAFVPDLLGPGRPAAVRRHQPRPVDRRDPDPLRAPGQPLLPGAAEGRDHRAADRPGRRDGRRRPRLPALARASASPTWSGGRRPGPTSSTPTSSARAASSWRAGGRDPAAGGRGRRDHGVPQRLRAEEGGARPAAGGLAGAELWVVPNPSGLNAHATVATLAEAYAEPARAAGILG